MVPMVHRLHRRGDEPFERAHFPAQARRLLVRIRAERVDAPVHAGNERLDLVFQNRLERDAFAREHALAVETLVAGAFRWYAETNERACLAEVREARSRLRDRRKDGGLDATVAADAALLSRGFHTRLSNIHACVSSLRAFREDCAVLWRSRAASGRDALETRDDSDSSDDEAAVEDGDEDRSSAESASFGDLMRSLRCSRASVIASATELLMDADMGRGTLAHGDGGENDLAAFLIGAHWRAYYGLGGCRVVVRAASAVLV